MGAKEVTVYKVEPERCVKCHYGMFIGGMWAVTYTDIFQFLVMTAGVIILCPILAISMQEREASVDKKKPVIDETICLGCGVCARNCPKKAITLQRRPVEVITPVNSTHRFVLQAIEKGTLQNLVFDNQAFANHRAMAAVFGTILRLPPLKQAMASRQFKSVYLDHLLAAQKKA